MREDEFRDRFRAALGDAPDEPGAAQRAAAVLHRPPAREERAGPPRAMALVAGVLTVVVVAGLVGSRVLRHLAPSTSQAGAGAALAACRLPMVVMDNRGAASSPVSGLRFTAGFVSLPSGRFTADPSVRGGSTPFAHTYVGQVWAPQSYDVALGRWLPADSTQVSPDRQSYLYVVQTPPASGKGAAFDSTTLHVYDVTTGQDRTLWTTRDQINPNATWAADGIHADTAPAGGGASQSWLVDPSTGAITASAQAAFPGADWASIANAYRVTFGAQLGTDSAGNPVLVEGTGNPGADQDYFVGGPNGQRVYIYHGPRGGALDFDPNSFIADGDRLWAANSDGTAVWLWTAADGLRRFALAGVARHDPYVIPRVAGPCL